MVRGQSSLARNPSAIFPVLTLTYPAEITPHMRFLPALLLGCMLLGCGHRTPKTPEQRYEIAINELQAAKTPSNRFYALNDAAKDSFVVGKVEEAKKYAEELMTLTPQFPGDWNHGNAVQDANLVLGRIAVREGRIDDAKRYLVEAGKSTGSPQMNSFGPNMSLAKDLLEKGEKQVVLDHFETCRKYWKLHDGRLDQWRDEVQAGRIPDFGANLDY